MSTPEIATPVSTLPLPPVRLDAFEGPLDVLLHLIRSQKMNIFDIPIASMIGFCTWFSGATPASSCCVTCRMIQPCRV